MILDLANENLVIVDSISNLGRVETAIAVRAGDSVVTVKDAAGLREAFLAADAIFIPDTKASTAGIHIAKVLQQLDIADEVAVRLRIFPNGATAMRHLAASDAVKPIGCTQSTEIISTAGVIFSGSMPPGCDLATLYTAAVGTGTPHARQAPNLIRFFTSDDQPARRIHSGFFYVQKKKQDKKKPPPTTPPKS